jgi:hypothetical protein
MNIQQLVNRLSEDGFEAHRGAFRHGDLTRAPPATQSSAHSLSVPGRRVSGMRSLFCKPAMFFSLPAGLLDRVRFPGKTRQ